MIARLIVRTAAWLLVMAALLFLPAGTWRWPQAWILLAEMGILGLAVGLWLARHDPALLQERLRSLVQPDQKRWDKIGIVVIGLFWCAWLALMALDAGRFHGSRLSLPWNLVGVACIAVSIYAAYRTFRENSFAIPVIKVQTARHQTVVATGPYGFVRHPLYAGALFMFVGIPLLLGSWWGLALSPVLMAAVAVRAMLEERVLEAELDGYAHYKTTVRYRLIPLLW